MHKPFRIKEIYVQVLTSPKTMTRLYRCCFSFPVLFLLSPGCLPTSSTSLNLDQLQKIATMETKPCFGTCPVYTLTVYEKGVATYEGERYTERLGLYSRFLTKEEFAAVEHALRETNLWKYQDVYQSRIPDLPTVKITQFEPDGRQKSVAGKDGRPESIMALEELFRKIAESGNWKLREEAAEQLPEGAIRQEIIVQLQPGTEVENWALSYNAQGLEVVKKLSPTIDYYLVQYDVQKIQPQAMLDKIRSDMRVVGAEFNKTLSPRD